MAWYFGSNMLNKIYENEFCLFLFTFLAWLLKSWKLLLWLTFLLDSTAYMVSKRRGISCFNDLEINCLAFLRRAVYTHLSLFFVRRFRSMPSIRFSKHRCIACCFSGGWLFTILFLRSEKYCGARRETGSGEKMGKGKGGFTLWISLRSSICRVEGAFFSKKKMEYY